MNRDVVKMRSDWRKGTIRTEPRPGLVSLRSRNGATVRQPVRMLRRLMLGLLELCLLAWVLGALSGG